MAFRKDEVLWFRVAENTFDNFMARQSAAEQALDRLDDRDENPAPAGFFAAVLPASAGFSNCIPHVSLCALSKS